MRAINKYKHIIEELYFIYSTLEEGKKDDCLDYLSLKLLEKQETKTMHYANKIAEEIKEEIIGDGKEAEFKGRLKTAYWELKGGLNLETYYFPTFNSSDISMSKTLLAVYGDEAKDVIEVVKSISQWANYMVQNVCSMIDEVCKFVGYIPEHQQQPQQKGLHYYCQKAIDKGFLKREEDGYRRVTWTKVQLAYFLGHFLKPDKTFPDSEYCKMFAENRLGKALYQISGNKNGDGKPRGYEIIDELLQD